MPAALPQITTSKAKELLAQGVNQTDTAKQLSIDRSTVNKLAKKHRKEIETLALDLVSQSIKPIRDLHVNTLNLSAELIDLTSKCDSKTKYHRLKGISNLLAMSGMTAKDILTLADKKEYRALQIMGIAPSHTPSVVIKQLLNVNVSHNIVDPGVQSAIGGHLAGILDNNDVIEADYTEDMINTEGVG